ATAKPEEKRAATLSRLVGHFEKARGADRTRSMEKVMDFAAKERDRDLQLFAVGALTRSQGSFSKQQREKFGALKKEVLPEKPELPQTGPLRVKHYIGDEFYRGEVAVYRRAGF